MVENVEQRDNPTLSFDDEKEYPIPGQLVGDIAEYLTNTYQDRASYIIGCYISKSNPLGPNRCYFKVKCDDVLRKEIVKWAQEYVATKTK